VEESTLAVIRTEFPPRGPRTVSASSAAGDICYRRDP